MASKLALGCLCAIAVVLAPGSAPASRAPDPPDLRSALLRLPDLPRGYRVADGGCGVATAEGAPPRLLEIVRNSVNPVCSIDFRRHWLEPGRAAHTAPPSVHSAAIGADTPERARALVAVAAELLDYLGADQGRPREPSRHLGEETVALDTRALANGRTAPGVGVVWRAGRVVNVVHVAAASTIGLLDAAFALADRQHARLEQPTPIGPGENDDLEVALDNPRLPFPILWLGRRFDPPGALPPLDLELSDAAPNGISGPGYRAHLWYRAAGAGTTIIGIWRPRDFAAFRRTRLGRLVWSSPCTRRRTLQVRGGRAILFAGYRTTPRRPCPSRSPDRHLAYVARDGVVVSIAWPHCLCEPNVPADSSAYNSLRGMETLVRGLQRRRL